MSNDFDEQKAVSYFLGNLSEEEREKVEESSFLDPEFGDFLDEVETDLIDSYVRGELDPAAKRNFERNFLVSERRRERVRAARILGRENVYHLPSAETVPSVSETKAGLWETLREKFRLPQFGLAFAAGFILLLFLLGGIMLFRRRPPEFVRIGNENISGTPTPSIAREETPRESLVSNQNTNIKPQNTATPPQSPVPTPKAEEKPKQVPPPKQQPVVASFSLDPSPSVRTGGGGTTQNLSIKKETESLRLKLDRNSEEEFERFNVELRDAGRRLIFTRNLRNRKALTVVIPARRLPPGRYELILKGAKADEDFDELNTYNFTIVRK
jgi:hypothetical protein